MNFNTLKNFDNLHGQIVLVRVDFNVPMKNGVIKDNTRIQAHIPTIKNLIEKDARIVLMSHLGRPKCQETEFSLLPVANELEKLLDHPVSFCSSTEKQTINQAKSALKNGEILVLENIRFFEGETTNDTFLASMLSEEVALYVNDAFASSHRSHTSVDAICKFVNKKALGLLMEKEIANLTKIEEFKKDNKKIAVVVSGAKVSTKLALLSNLVTIADEIFIGGAMANTFLAAQGLEVGTSLTEPEMFKQAQDILTKATKHNCTINLPTDVICAYEVKEYSEISYVEVADIPASMMALDLGPKTIVNWLEKLQNKDLIIINGPLGVFEVNPFNKATTELFTKLADITAYKVAGGGDTIFAIKQSKTENNFNFVSTGGGALLEALEGKTLPGVKSQEL